MFKKLRALFAWQSVFESGVYRYWENSITGERRAQKIYFGHSPLDKCWLDRTDPKPIIPPTGGSGVKR